MKHIALLGNFSFNHFDTEEMRLFKTDNERKALIHELEEIKIFDTKDEMYYEVDNTEYDAWIIPNEFNGEIAFERIEDKDLYNSI